MILLYLGEIGLIAEGRLDARLEICRLKGARHVLVAIFKMDLMTDFWNGTNEGEAMTDASDQRGSKETREGGVA